MPQGLQVWDANGVNILDTNNLLGRVLGIREVASASGSVTDARISQGRLFYTVYSSAPQTDFLGGPMIVTVSGNTISWRNWTRSIGNAFLAYGIF